MAANSQKKGRIIIGGIIVAVLVSFVGLLMFLSSIYKTETYWELNTDVPTRTQITPEMLNPVTTSEGTAPVNALSLEDIQGGGIFTQYPLNAGDILTPSNVGGYEDISVGVPDEWVVTNFSVNADNAVQGRIRRGVYFDMMVLEDNGGNSGAYYPFINILALDATVSLSNASSADAIEGEEAYAGQTSQYTVGMAPADAARLHAILNNNSNVRLVLSPRQNEYNAPDVEAYTGLFVWDSTVEFDDKWTPKPMGEGTDYTFSQVDRDKFGRPIPKVDTCGDGNAKIPAEDCADYEKTKQEWESHKDAKVIEEEKPADSTTEGN